MDAHSLIPTKEKEKKVHVKYPGKFFVILYNNVEIYIFEPKTKPFISKYMHLSTAITRSGKINLRTCHLAEGRAKYSERQHYSICFHESPNLQSVWYTD